MNASDKDQLKRINLNIADWEQKRDTEAIQMLGTIISQQFLFRRADKTVVGKRKFMKDLSKPSPFARRKSKIEAIAIRGDLALVTLAVTTTKKDGTKSSYRNIRMFVRRGKEWQLEFWFNDDVTQVTGL